MTTRRRFRSFRAAVRPGAAVTACILLLTACGSSQALNPTPIPTAVPTITATPEVGFAVAVTAVPTRPPRGARPKPTAFRPPQRPYIVLSSAAGPPVQRVIVVRGGHLPRSSPITLGWSLKGKSAPISTTVYTDRTGALRARFTVPASPPGSYRVLASISGVLWASAGYRIRSQAVLWGAVAPSRRGERITLRGHHFIPHGKLLLVAYPLAAHGKPIVIGTVRSDGSGAFTYTQTVAKLPLGQYVVRAWSQNAFAAEMAEAFIQVVI